MKLAEALQERADLNRRMEQLKRRLTANALVQEGDLIRLDIPGRRLELIGVAGEEKTPEEMADILAARKAAWQRPEPRYTRGVLKRFTQNARSPMEGGGLE